MICLAYLSSASSPVTSAMLDAILNSSVRNNGLNNVTGLLCHFDGSFLQFLEGEEAHVLDTFDRIAGDDRHHGLIEVCRKSIDARAFADWSMGLVKVDDVGPAARAFCTGLRQVEIDSSASHRKDIEPFLDSFRAWVR